MKNLATALRSEEVFEGKNNENGIVIKRRGDPPTCRVNFYATKMVNAEKLQYGIFRKSPTPKPLKIK